MRHKLAIYISLCCAMTIPMTGCGNKATSPDQNTSPKISGVVSAPGNATTGGSIAALKPGVVDSLLAMLFGKQAEAGFSGLYAVSGATIDLIKIDSSGNQVGSVLATATTDSSGSYTLSLPDNFTPSAEYVIRATKNSASMDAVVAGTDNDIDVDPVSDAARQLLTTNATNAGTSLANINADAVSEMVESVVQAARSTDLSNDLSGATLTSTAGYVAAIKDAVAKDEEAVNAVASVAAATKVCGTVTNALGSAIPRILIVVRRYSDWVPQARTLTDTTGAYCLNVPAGDYIIGANNHKILGFAASEWFTAGGGDVKRKLADKITVSSGTLTKNFVLSPGGRIAGRITAQDTGNALPGVAVTVRDWNTNTVTFSVKTDVYGYYRLNLPPGDYLIDAQNHTLKSYASEYWNDDIDGGMTRGFAKKISVTASAVSTANFDLLPGRPVYGVVQDGAGTALSGIPVDIRETASFVTAATTRTNINGRFRVQLYKGLYSVIARGKNTSADTRTSATAIVLNYPATAQPVTITDAAVSAIPLGDVKVILRNSTGGFISSESTNSLGNATVYAASTTSSATNRLNLRVDDGRAYESQVYNGIYTALANGTNVDTTVGVSDATNSVINATLTGSGVIVGGRVTFATGGTTYGVQNATVMIYDGATTNLFDSIQTNSDGYYSLTLHSGQTYSAKARLVAHATALTTQTATITVGTTNTLDIPLDTAMGPPMPLGVYAELGNAGTGSVTLNWKPVAHISAYNVYASTTANTTPSGTPTAQTAAGATSTTLSLTSGVTYYIRVASVDPNTSSIISATYPPNEISVVAP